MCVCNMTRVDVHKGVRWGEGVPAFLKNTAASLIPMTHRVNVMKGGLRNQHSHSMFRGRGLGRDF